MNQEERDYEAVVGHRIVATSMIVATVVVMISQNWLLAIRRWITSKVHG